VLESVPNTIEAMYSHALQNILPKDMDIAQSILMLLLCTRDSLGAEVATDYAGLSSPSQLIQICSSTLLQLDRLRDTLEFSHSSVETFLLSNKTKLLVSCIMSNDIPISSETYMSTTSSLPTNPLVREAEDARILVVRRNRALETLKLSEDEMDSLATELDLVS
jgi:hypothetical protein